ncbi:hypothetical protein, partial [Rhodococcus opacus]|uniref:hypothetical protein n=1 Tax=Rhodococcus opacus TaxID=37919 RepID=UPI0018E16C72
MTVKAWLTGHQFDLQDLANLLPVGDTRVVPEGDGYYLTSTVIDNSEGAKRFTEVAPEVLRYANGVGRVHDPGFRSVTLSGHYDDDVTGQHLVVAEGETLRIRDDAIATAVVTGPDGVERDEPVQLPPSPGPAYASLARDEPTVAKVLAYMGQLDPLSPNAPI